MSDYIKTFEEILPGDLLLIGTNNEDDLSSCELCIRKFFEDDPIRDVVNKNGCYVNCRESMLTLTYEGKYMLVDRTYFSTAYNEGGIFLISRL